MRLLCIFVFVASSVFAQSEIDIADTSKQHSVRKAILFSAVLPGSGQVYNHIHMPKGQKKAFWKVPLIYAGLGATGYYFVKNYHLQRELKTEYSNRIDSLPTDPNWALYDNQGVLTLYNQHRNRQDLFLLGTILVYALQIADAGVEAHFVHFDVSEDLSFSMAPEASLHNRSIGVSVKLNFR